MKTQQPEKNNVYREEYRFDILTLKSVITFLKALHYEIVEYEDGRWEGDHYDESWTKTIHLCAIKPGEEANLYNNEIPVVFRKEFEKSLLRLLVHSSTLPAQPQELR